MNYTPKLPLWPHQQEALAKMRGREYFSLFMAMRTGKSPTILSDFGAMELEGMVQDLMIIAPAGVYRTWITAMEEHLSDDLRERMLVHVWQSGMSGKEKKRLDWFMKEQDRPRCMLMNVEALSRPGEARIVAQDFLRQRKNYVACDESTVIKNSSKRTAFINKHIRPLATYRRILSGLPTPRSPLDLYFQCEFLDWNILGFRSWYSFRSRVAILKRQNFGGRSFDMVVGYKDEAVAELQTLIEPHSFRVAFRPKVPSTYSIREVEMTKEQEKAYREMRDFATTKLANDAHITATVVIAQIMRMHQVLLGHARSEDGEEQFFPEKRTESLLELLDDYGGAKALIWCSYDYNIRKVSEALIKEYGEGSVARFWGGNVNTRDEEVKLFKTDPKCRFMIATPDSGGRGQTWDVADLAVYFSSKDNLEHRDQSEQRTMGLNKERGVDIVDLICPGTIEMKILEALRKKINMSSVITRDSWREWVV